MEFWKRTRWLHTPRVADRSATPRPLGVASSEARQLTAAMVPSVPSILCTIVGALVFARFALPAANAATLACQGATVLAATSDASTLSDGSGADTYGNGQRCAWHISTTTPGATVRIEFLAFDLQPVSPGGCRDWVRIHDGPTTTSPVMATYCGGMLPPPFTSTGAALTVQFFTDSSIVARGFEALYVAGKCSAPHSGAPACFPPCVLTVPAPQWHLQSQAALARCN